MYNLTAWIQPNELFIITVTTLVLLVRTVSPTDIDKCLVKLDRKRIGTTSVTGRANKNGVRDVRHY